MRKADETDSGMKRVEWVGNMRNLWFKVKTCLLPVLTMMLAMTGCGSTADLENLEENLSAASEILELVAEGLEEIEDWTEESAEAAVTESAPLPEATKATRETEATETTETAEATKAPEATETAEATQATEATETVEATKAPDATETSGRVDFTKSSQVAATQDIYDTEAVIIDPDGFYTTVEDVSLYLYTYGELPQNFMTKKEARALGWSGGSLEEYAPGMCIGGDYFGNYEGMLPKAKNRDYYECDIDTLGAGSRGAKRIVYSDDGLIYYTEDHYESFELLYGEE